MARRAKYTAAERRAYATGKAYKLGKEGRRIKFENEKNKAAFRAGYKSPSVAKYPKTGGKA